MNECSQYKFIHNSKLKNSDEFKNEFFKNGLSLYEVIRVVNSTPVFLEDHLGRLENSAKQTGQFIWLDFKELIEKIKWLIHKNGAIEGNVKIVFNIQNNNRNFYCYFVDHKYPSLQEYKNGVETVIYSAERRNPNAKVYNKKLRTYTNTLIDDPDIYEVILIDNLNHIREGSRSNLFFIKGNILFTAPDADVLNGIVRDKIVGICKHLNIEIRKEKIDLSKLSLFDSVFLTGTSPQVLPIRKINNLLFDVNHPLLNLLLETYRKELNRYLLQA